MLEINKVHNMDCLEGMKLIPDNFVHLVVTSPPYNMDDKRYYKNYDDNKEDYVSWITSIFKEYHRILDDRGVVCFNISYNSNSKSEYIKIINNALEIGFLLQETVAWVKKGMPLTEVRNLTRDFEFIFILTKSKDYFTNQLPNQVISNVWKFKNLNIHNELNQACFPEDLPRRCIKLFSEENDLVLDSFMGSGTTAVVCKQLNRNYIGFEIDHEQFNIIKKRISQTNLIEGLNKGWFS